MKNLIPIINSKKSEIASNEIIKGIVCRAHDKFMKKSNNEIILFELVDYVKSQLTWKKQSFYQWLLPILLECCERLNQPFEMIFDTTPKNWREANDELY